MGSYCGSGPKSFTQLYPYSLSLLFKIRNIIQVIKYIKFWKEQHAAILSWQSFHKSGTFYKAYFLLKLLTGHIQFRHLKNTKYNAIYSTVVKRYQNIYIKTYLSQFFLYDIFINRINWGIGLYTALNLFFM